MLIQLMLLGAVLVVVTLGFCVAVVEDARNEIWSQAEQSSANLAIALERDIARNFEMFDLSLQGAVQIEKLPGINDVSAEIRHAAIFDRDVTAEFIGSILVLDKSGNVRLDSTALVPHALDLSERDYFTVHRSDPGRGLYVSLPYHSRLRENDPSIAISRRIDDANGHFDGVVAGGLKLSYFRQLFGHLKLGKDGVVSLFRMDGPLIAREPYKSSDFGRNVSAASRYAQLEVGQSVQVVTSSALDGVKRLYTSRRVGSLPLILSVGTSFEEIYAPWWRKAIAIATTLSIMCTVTILLCVLFRGEMIRRLAAEVTLRGQAEQLALMATTDELSGLSNRRAFETEMARSWRRATRTQRPIALLMIDADKFKTYNDQYGHPAGDKVLSSIGGCIDGNIQRPDDFGARYGGEEFVVLLPDTPLSGALEVAERIRKAVEACNIVHDGNQTGHVTISIGASVAFPSITDPQSMLIEAADVALYKAKRDGRNRVHTDMAIDPISPFRLPRKDASVS